MRKTPRHPRASASPPAAGAHAQAWPAKPVTLLVPFPPGGSTDMIARTLAPKLQEKLGGTFIVDNKAGAGGTVGAAQAKRAAPDGYTIFVSSLGPVRDRAAPGQERRLRPAEGLRLHHRRGAGAERAGGAGQLAAQVVRRRARVPQGQPRQDDASPRPATAPATTSPPSCSGSRPAPRGLHVPYKGGAPAMSDLLGGQVDATFMNINTGLPNIKAGKLRALAITSAKRSPLLPDVPTMEELGHQGRHGLLVAGVRGAEGPARRHQGEAARRPRRRAERPAGQAEAARARLRDRRQHAGAVHRLPGRRVRALEEGDRGRQDHRRLTRFDDSRALPTEHSTMAEASFPRSALHHDARARQRRHRRQRRRPARGHAFPVGPDAGRQGAAGPQGRARRPRRGRSGAALQRGDRPRGARHSRRQLGARAAAGDAGGALARRPADRDRQARRRCRRSRATPSRATAMPTARSARATSWRSRRPCNASPAWSSSRSGASRSELLPQYPERRRRRRPGAHLRLRRGDRRARRDRPDPHAAQHQR